MTHQAAINILSWALKRPVDIDSIDAEDAIKTITQYAAQSPPFAKYHKVVELCAGNGLTVPQAAKKLRTSETAVRSLLKSGAASYRHRRFPALCKRINGYPNLFRHEAPRGPRYIRGHWKLIVCKPETGDRILERLKRLKLKRLCAGLWEGKRGRIRRVELHYIGKDHGKVRVVVFLEMPGYPMGTRVPPHNASTDPADYMT